MNTPFCSDCHRCKRRDKSQQVVWPTIVPGAKILIVGEAPDKDEDTQGRGFVGPAGDLLRGALTKLGLNPETDVSYINSVACYGGNVSKKPTAKETETCSRHLWRGVIAATSSGTNVIVAAGKFAYKALMGVDCKITEENGTKKACKPPMDVWNSVRAENFCHEHRIDISSLGDGISPEIYKDVRFQKGYLPQMQDMGFQVEDPPLLNVVPVLHPRYFIRERVSEVYKMERALKVALNWSTGEVFQTPSVGKDYQAIFTPEPAIEYMDFLIGEHAKGEIEYIAVDLETVGSEEDPVKGGLKPFAPGGRVITINLAHKIHAAVVIYMHHPETKMSATQQAAVAEKYCELLAKVPIAGANLKFDMHWSRFKLGAKKWTIAHDTQLMHYAIHLGTQPNGLKEITAKYLEHDAGFEDDLKAFLGSLDKGDRHYDNIPANMLTTYAAHDVDVVLQLIPMLTADLHTAKQWQQYQDFLIHPYPAFIEMEQNGAFLDADIVSELKGEYEKRVEEPVKWFRTSAYWNEWVIRRSAEAAKKRAEMKTEKSRNKPVNMEKEIDVNFSSPIQVAELLFDVVRLPIYGDRGKVQQKVAHIFPEGVPTTGEEALENIKAILVNAGEVEGPRIEILEKIMEHRKDAKVLSGYLKKAMEHCPVVAPPEWWHGRDLLQDPRSFEAELYGSYCQSMSYNLTRARTGRTTSSDPNIQQVTWRMRKMYPARPIEPERVLNSMGLDPAKNIRRLIANFDVGQAELRMLAVASQDSNFLETMRDPNRDIHREIAAVAYGKGVSDVTKDERTNTKGIVFGTVFGRSPQAVAAELKIPVEQAKGIQATLFSMMPQTAQWIAEKHAEGQSYGEIWTPTGRKRDLRMYHNKGERNRRSVNTPIQGGASDLTLWATGWVHKEMKRVGIHSLIWGFVHDSIDFDLYPQEAEYLMKICHHYFTVATPQYFTWYNVPLVLEFEFGVDWGKQVPAEYNIETREFKIEAEAENLRPVYEAFAPLLVDIEVDPEWAAHEAAGDSVWAKGKFV